jgi:hypothetical protein
MAGGMLLQSAATTGNGSEVNCFGHSGTYALSVVCSGTAVSAGELQWETAPTEAYSGTWSPVGSAIIPVAGAVVTATVQGAFHRMRCRITQDIAGTGSPAVTVRMQPPLLGF